MRTPRIRRGLAAATLVLLAGGVAACGTETDEGEPGQSASDNQTDGGGDGGAGPAPDEEPASGRLAEVAEAWEGSDAAAEWREGYYPVDGPVRLPIGGLGGRDDQRAFDRGAFDLATDLPDGHTRDERIRWEDGTARPVTAISAEEALGVVDTGAAQGPGPVLEVTGAEAGQMRLDTSRGPATVPAWHFTLDGYDTPLVIAAVAVPEPLKAPVEPDEAGEPSPAQPLEELVEVADDGRSVTVTAGHGACDGGADVEVYETGDTVVLGGVIIEEQTDPNVACTDQLLLEPVTVELAEPVGERALLDAFDGELLLDER